MKAVYGIKKIEVGTIPPDEIFTPIGITPSGQVTELGPRKEGQVFQVDEGTEISFIEPEAFNALDKRQMLPHLIIDGKEVHIKRKTKVLRVLIRNKSFARPVFYTIEVPRDFTRDQSQSLANYIKFMYNNKVPFSFTKI